MHRALILDMDGLMVDTERLYVQTMRQVARLYGREVSDATLARMMGRAPLESIRIFVSDLGLTQTPQSILNLREGMMLELFATDLVPMPGLADLLEYARSRPLRLAIATGSPRKFIPPILGRLGIADLFQVIQTGDEVTHGKPHPEIYQKTADQLALPPAECLVLEDSANGVRAAHAAGCYVIAVPNDHTRGQDFTQANFVASSLWNARDHIRQIVV